jgi:protein PsiE
MEKIAKTLQLALLSIILISTVIAVGIEIKNMFLNQSVTLADLLLMFLYLEVLAMVRVFWDQQSISITLPLLIAITALARFIILQGKEMDPSALVYEAVAIVLIASAIVILRLALKEEKNKYYLEIILSLKLEYKILE